MTNEIEKQNEYKIVAGILWRRLSKDRNVDYGGL